MVIDMNISLHIRPRGGSCKMTVDETSALDKAVTNKHPSCAVTVMVDARCTKASAADARSGADHANQSLTT